MSLNLQIISPEKTLYNDEIDLCILPGIEGDFGVLKKHMPFLTTLRTGIAYIYKNNTLTEKLLVNGGVVEVLENKCTILSEDIVKSDEYRPSNDENKIEKIKNKVVKKFYYS